MKKGVQVNNLEPIIICKHDFECVGQVAKHCDWEQLCIYIREQQNLSLLPKIGQCIFDKLLKYCQGWFVKGEMGSCHEQEADVLKHLFLGGRYIACDGTSKVHFGLKRVLVHWSYGAYVYRHGYVDTPFGVVQKINQDSIPAPMNELQRLNTEQRNNAEYYWKLTKDFLCAYKDCEALADCKICDCIQDCKCTSCKNGGKGTEQRRGPRFQNITKYD